MYPSGGDLLCGLRRKGPYVVLPEFCDSLFQLINQVELHSQAGGHLVFLDSLKGWIGFSYALKALFN